MPWLSNNFAIRISFHKVIQQVDVVLRLLRGNRWKSFQAVIKYREKPNKRNRRNNSISPEKAN